MRKKISGVYKITNTVTNDFYIGSSKDVKLRWATHKCKYTWKRFPNNPLYLNMQKYGVDKFIFEILAEVESYFLKEKEQQFIELLKPTYNNYNAKGWDFKRRKETNKKAIRKYKKTDKGKESNRKSCNKYMNQLCLYNGEVLTLNTLSQRFRRAGIDHPTIEAKKYILKNNNPIEFYDVYP